MGIDDKIDNEESSPKENSDYPSENGVSPNHQSLRLIKPQSRGARMRMNLQNPMPCKLVIFSMFFSVILSVSLIYFHQLNGIWKPPRCRETTLIPQPYRVLLSQFALAIINVLPGYNDYCYSSLRSFLYSPISSSHLPISLTSISQLFILLPFLRKF